jgi:membrane-associated protease RseP (regulator of RpoE activity)
VVPRPLTDGFRIALTLPHVTISASRWAVHWLLFGLTFVTTTIVGVVLTLGFESNRPIDLDQYVSVFAVIGARPLVMLQGLAFSVTLMSILLAHELGHYFACLYYGIDASLPYFLPFPSPIGTLGAFIRIRSPIYTRRALFDVGIAGPLAGFVMLLPAMAIGLAYSKVIPGIAERGELIFGVPAIQRALEWVMFPGVRAADIYLHPVARAAWVGTLATALNLLPIGQLDGGHILYSVAGNRHKLVSWIFLLLLVALGIWLWHGWLVWAVLLFFGRRHPSIIDPEMLGAGRKQLAWLTLIIFLLCFTPAPLRENAGF